MTFLVRPTPRTLWHYSLWHHLQQPPTDTWCKRAACHGCPLGIVIKILPLISSSCFMQCVSSVCVCVCGLQSGNMNESSTFLSPSSAPSCCSSTFHWQGWRGAGVFSGWVTTESPGSDSHWVSRVSRDTVSQHLAMNQASFIGGFYSLEYSVLQIWTQASIIYEKHFKSKIESINSDCT